jgi:TetR/AcrR family transcriptional repressor of lmrAB and yxaGH operons
MNDTKERLIRTGEQMFRRQGYEGSGLKQLVAQAGAPWGSLYHFFPNGKEQLGAEVLAYAAELYAAGWDRIFAASSDPVDAVRRAFRSEVKILEASGFAQGCPVASVTLDVASTVEGLRVSCAAAFQTWSEAISRGLRKRGVPDAAADDLAVFILSSLEGAIVLSRAAHSTRALKQTSAYVELAVTAALEGQAAA